MSIETRLLTSPIQPLPTRSRWYFSHSALSITITYYSKIQRRKQIEDIPTLPLPHRVIMPSPQEPQSFKVLRHFVWLPMHPLLFPDTCQQSCVVLLYSFSSHLPFYFIYFHLHPIDGLNGETCDVGHKTRCWGSCDGRGRECDGTRVMREGMMDGLESAQPTQPLPCGWTPTIDKHTDK